MVLHKRIVLTLIFIFLLITLGFADITHINSACLNSSVLRTTTLIEKTGSNTTDTIESISCPYGCDTVYNMCYEEGIFTNETLFIICIAIVIIASLYLFRLFQKSGEDLEETSTLNSGLKILFLLIALFFQYLLFLRIGIFSESLTNTIIEKGGSDALGIAIGTFYLFFIVAGLFMIFFIAEIFIKRFNLKGDKKPKKYKVIAGE